MERTPRVTPSRPCIKSKIGNPACNIPFPRIAPPIVNERTRRDGYVEPRNVKRAKIDSVYGRVRNIPAG